MLLQQEEMFQDTELGSLPEQWKVVVLSQVASFTKKPMGFKLPAKIPFIPMELIPNGGKTHITVYKLLDKVTSGLYVEKGDILLPKITPSFENGKQGIVGDIPGSFAYATTEVVPIKVSKLIDRHYLFFYFLHRPVRIDLAGKMEGTTGRQRIPKPVISNMLIPLPPLPEQRAIAHVLDAVQHSIEATERVIDAAKTLKRSLMKYLFTYGPAPVDQAEMVKLKETEVGMVPEGWEVVRIGDLSKVIRGASPRPKGDAKYFGGSVPRLMVADVTRDFMYVTPRIDFLTEEGAKLSRSMKRGSLVIQVSGNPGTPAILAVDACIHDGFAGLIELKTDKVNVEFLFHYLHITKYVHKRLAFGAVFQNLQTYTIRGFLVPLPSISLQEKIANALAKVDAKIQAESNRKAALEAIFNNLLHHLMTGKVRVGAIEAGGG